MTCSVMEVCALSSAFLLAPVSGRQSVKSLPISTQVVVVGTAVLERDVNDDVSDDVNDDVASVRRGRRQPRQRCCRPSADFMGGGAKGP